MTRGVGERREKRESQSKEGRVSFVITPHSHYFFLSPRSHTLFVILSTPLYHHRTLSFSFNYFFLFFVPHLPLSFTPPTLLTPHPNPQKPPPLSVLSISLSYCRPMFRSHTSQRLYYVFTETPSTLHTHTHKTLTSVSY